MIGRQIRFFFTPIDENLFLEEVKKCGDIFITDKGENLGVPDSSFFNTKSISQILIKSSKSSIYISPNKFIDRNKSEVIEYSRSVSNLFFKPLPPPKLTFESYVSRMHNDMHPSLLYREGKFIKSSDIPLEELKKEYELLFKKKDT